MKNLITIIAFTCFFISNALGATCASMGIIPGALCSTVNKPGGGSMIISMCMDDKDSDCIIANCSGTCMCIPRTHECAIIDPGCLPCFNPEPNWTSYPIKNYDRRSTTLQNSITCTCTTNYEYRCHVGYYGLAAMGQEPNCTKCPCFTSIIDGTTTCGTTATTGQSVITGCYIPKYTVVKDSAGSYDYTNDCFYAL